MEVTPHESEVPKRKGDPPLELVPKRSKEDPGQDKSPFEKLPRNLASKILQYVPECVFNVRSASQALKAHTDEYVKQMFLPVNRARVPTVERMLISPPHVLDYLFGENPPIGLFALHISFSMVQALFILNSHVALSARIKVIKVNGERHFVWLYNAKDKDVLSACFGSVNTVELSKHLMDDAYMNKMPEISYLLERIQFPSLSVSVENLAGVNKAFLVQLVTVSGVENLSMEVYDTSIDAVPMLQKFSTLLRSLRITQQQARSHHVEYLLGKDSFDWADIFSDMLVEKLECLTIENYYADYLSEEEALEITQVASLLGKQFISFGM